MLAVFGRVVLAWGAVVAFQLCGDVWLADLASPAKLAGLFSGLLVIILWCAFGVVRHADAGYDIAIDCAHEQALDLPMLR